MILEIIYFYAQHLPIAIIFINMDFFGKFFLDDEIRKDKPKKLSRNYSDPSSIVYPEYTRLFLCDH